MRYQWLEEEQQESGQVMIFESKTMTYCILGLLSNGLCGALCMPWSQTTELRTRGGVQKGVRVCCLYRSFWLTCVSLLFLFQNYSGLLRKHFLFCPHMFLNPSVWVVWVAVNQCVGLLVRNGVACTVTRKGCFPRARPRGWTEARSLSLA